MRRYYFLDFLFLLLFHFHLNFLIDFFERSLLQVHVPDVHLDTVSLLVNCIGLVDDDLFLSM